MRVGAGVMVCEGVAGVLGDAGAVAVDVDDWLAPVDGDTVAVFDCDAPSDGDGDGVIDAEAVIDGEREMDAVADGVGTSAQVPKPAP